jgi:N-acetylglucosaminyldiphosphoundecaprenol N-acetyl-beta-D-mannosaminyltransferase
MKQGKSTVLGVDFDLIEFPDVLNAIHRWRQDGLRRYIVISNPHSVMIARRDGHMRSATQQASLVLPDGIGIILAARILGLPHHGRITGPALMLNLCDHGRQLGLRHYFYGGSPSVVEHLASRLGNQFPGLNVAGSFSPPFHRIDPDEDRRIVNQINQTRPDIVWVGLGAPKQEIWMARHIGQIQASALIGVGAAFDFHAGAIPWAPAWIRTIGLEWAYRLCIEPKRLWSRNLDSPRFLLGILRQKFFALPQPAIDTA